MVEKDGSILVNGEHGWEVGFAYEGCNDPMYSDPEFPAHWADTRRAQRCALQQFLDRYGCETAAWVTPPEIRPMHYHDPSVGICDFGKTLAVNRATCMWAVYGVLREKPEVGWVPEGVRIPPGDMDALRD